MKDTEHFKLVPSRNVIWTGIEVFFVGMTILVVALRQISHPIIASIVVITITVLIAINVYIRRRVIITVGSEGIEINTLLKTLIITPHDFASIKGIVWNQKVWYIYEFTFTLFSGKKFILSDNSYDAQLLKKFITYLVTNNEKLVVNELTTAFRMDDEKKKNSFESSSYIKGKLRNFLYLIIFFILVYLVAIIF